MSNVDKKTTYGATSRLGAAAVGALKVGTIASASALLGGLAVAWWYRDTLRKLRNPIHSASKPGLETFESEFPDAERGEFNASAPESLPHLQD